MRVGSQMAFGAALAVIPILVLLPNAPPRHVPSEDAGVFLYAARTIAAGGLPYHDVWDHKPPGVYLLDLVAAGHVWGVFALQVAALVAASWLSYRALLHATQARLAAVFGVIAWLLAVPRLALEDGLQTNFAELYALPLQFAALGLFAADEARPSPTWRTAAIGVVGAGAALLKPTLVGIPVAIAIVLLVSRATSGRWADLARRALLMALAAAAAGAVVVAWLAAGGALDEAIDQVLRYNALYSGFASAQDRIGAVALGLRLVLPSGLALLAVAGALLALRGPRTPLVSLALIALPIEVGLASAGRAYHYYFLAWLPAMAVLAAHLWDRLGTWLGPRALRWTLVACVVMAIVPSFLVGRLALTSDDGLSREAAAYVASSTGPDDAVLVWGSRSEILVLAERRSPTRFVYQYAALATRGYGSPARVDELLADLERARPLLIVDTSRDSFVTPPLDRAGLAAWVSPEPQYVWPAETSRIVGFVEANYTRVATLPRSGWPVWRLRSR